MKNQSISVRGGELVITEDNIEISTGPWRTVKQIFRHSKTAMILSMIGLIGLCFSIIYNPDFFPRIVSLGFISLFALYMILLLAISKMQSKRTSDTKIPIHKVKKAKLKSKSAITSETIELIYTSDGRENGRIVWMAPPFISLENSVKDAEELFQNQGITVEWH